MTADAGSARAPVARGDRVPWWMGPASAAATLVLRALGATWRIDRRDLAAWDREIAAGRRCIFAFWHSRLLPLVITHRQRGIVVLVSRHRDGEWITRILLRLGFGAARGSSTRHGEEGARDLLRAARDGRLLAITPDGPRGPAEVVKPGLVWLASRTGLPVVPVATATDRAWVARSWDRFRVPLPFARVVVAYGEPITVLPGLDESSAEHERARIESAIAALTAAVRARAGEAAS